MSVPLDRIKRSVLRVQNSGWRLQRGVALSHFTNTCCPLGACLIADSGDQIPVWTTTLQLGRRLGMLDIETTSFAAGFDGIPFLPAMDIQAWSQGKAFVT